MEQMAEKGCFLLKEYMMQTYRRWKNLAVEDADLMRELVEVEGNAREIEDRFYRSLEFGTGGLRGVIGAGTNRMNIYTVGRATQGLANDLNRRCKTPAVAIAYDSRIKSSLFARRAAQVLAANGIRAMLYPQLMPTPALSFAVRRLGCDAGICVTASHNPAKYNGYKVYGADGCQITLEDAQRILTEIEKLDYFDSVLVTNEAQAREQGLIQDIPGSVVNDFLQDVFRQRIHPEADGALKVVYTPLNGAGRMCVTRILEMTGVEDVVLVKEQADPDGNFPTCPYPNPEIREALEQGLKLCEQVQPDLLLATDPDCDRVGIAVRQKGEYRLLSGNEVGVLLLDYIAQGRLKNKTMPQRPVAVKTIVTTDMAEAVAADYGVELVNVLTGFKFIGEQIGFLERKGEEDRYIFGFEESYGYLSGGYVRDKDAVDASMLICEMARYYKKQGKTLCDVMEGLYRKYGYYQNKLLSFAFEGAGGMERMQSMMKALRENPPKIIAGSAVCGWSDYQSSTCYQKGQTSAISLPKSNVLEYRMENGAKLIVRPSGTEPKIKAYLSVKGNAPVQSEQEMERLCAAAPVLLGI